jgi:hypothetical protein
LVHPSNEREIVETQNESRRSIWSQLKRGLLLGLAMMGILMAVDTIAAKLLGTNTNQTFTQKATR